MAAPNWNENLVEVTRVAPGSAPTPSSGNSGLGVDPASLRAFLKHAGGTFEHLALLDDLLDAPQENLLHNASLDIWLEGTSFVSPASGLYTAEGFRHEYSGGMAVTITKDTFVPTPSAGHDGFAKVNASYKVDVTTADAALAAGDYFIVEQRVEGYTFNGVAQRKAVVSVPFYTDRSGGMTVCLSVSNSGGDRSWVKEFVVPAGAWVKLEMPIDPSPSAGTWDYTNGIGLKVRLCLMAGSTYQTTQGAWQSGNYFATGNQTNGMDSTANNFWFCEPKLEPGDRATIFVPEPIQLNLDRCYRYYYKSFPHGTAPGTLGSGYFTGIGFSIIAIFSSVHFPVEMRSTPTVAFYSPTTGTVNKVRDVTAAVDRGTGAIAVLDVNSAGFGGVIDTGAPFVAGNHHTFHFTANARL